MTGSAQQTTPPATGPLFVVPARRCVMRSEVSYDDAMKAWFSEIDLHKATLGKWYATAANGHTPATLEARIGGVLAGVRVRWDAAVAGVPPPPVTLAPGIPNSVDRVSLMARLWKGPLRVLSEQKKFGVLGRTLRTVSGHLTPPPPASPMMDSGAFAGTERVADNGVIELTIGSLTTKLLQEMTGEVSLAWEEYSVREVFFLPGDILEYPIFSFLAACGVTELSQHQFNGSGSPFLGDTVVRVADGGAPTPAARIHDNLIAMRFQLLLNLAVGSYGSLSKTWHDPGGGGAVVIPDRASEMALPDAPEEADEALTDRMAREHDAQIAAWHAEAVHAPPSATPTPATPPAQPTPPARPPTASQIARAERARQNRLRAIRRAYTKMRQRLDEWHLAQQQGLPPRQGHRGRFRTAYNQYMAAVDAVYRSLDDDEDRVERREHRGRVASAGVDYNNKSNSVHWQSGALSGVSVYARGMIYGGSLTNTSPEVYGQDLRYYDTNWGFGNHPTTKLTPSERCISRLPISAEADRLTLGWVCVSCTLATSYLLLHGAKLSLGGSIRSQFDLNVSLLHEPPPAAAVVGATGAGAAATPPQPAATQPPASTSPAPTAPPVAAAPPAASNPPPPVFVLPERLPRRGAQGHTMNVGGMRRDRFMTFWPPVVNDQNVVIESGLPYTEGSLDELLGTSYDAARRYLIDRFGATPPETGQNLLGAVLFRQMRRGNRNVPAEELPGPAVTPIGMERLRQFFLVKRNTQFTVVTLGGHEYAHVWLLPHDFLAKEEPVAADGHMPFRTLFDSARDAGASVEDDERATIARVMGGEEPAADPNVVAGSGLIANTVEMPITATPPEERRPTPATPTPATAPTATPPAAAGRPPTQQSDQAAAPPTRAYRNARSVLGASRRPSSHWSTLERNLDDGTDDLGGHGLDSERLWEYATTQPGEPTLGPPVAGFIAAYNPLSGQAYNTTRMGDFWSFEASGNRIPISLGAIPETIRNTPWTNIVVMTGSPFRWEPVENMMVRLIEQHPRLGTMMTISRDKGGSAPSEGDQRLQCFSHVDMDELRNVYRNPMRFERIVLYKRQYRGMHAFTRASLPRATDFDEQANLQATRDLRSATQEFDQAKANLDRAFEQAAADFRRQHADARGHVLVSSAQINWEMQTHPTQAMIDAGRAYHDARVAHEAAITRYEGLVGAPKEPALTADSVAAAWYADRAVPFPTFLEVRHDDQYATRGQVVSQKTPIVEALWRALKNDGALRAIANGAIPEDAANRDERVVLRHARVAESIANALTLLGERGAGPTR